jgi:hypothetical protein
MILALSSWPRLSHENGSKLGLCAKTQTHAHKCDKNAKKWSPNQCWVDIKNFFISFLDIIWDIYEYHLYHILLFDIQRLC